MPTSWRIWSVRMVYLVLAGLALANSGCAAAAIGAVAAAGAGAGGYMYLKGESGQDFVANLDDVHNATHAALQEMHMPIVKDDHDAGSAYIESRTADGVTVHVKLKMETSRIPAEGAVTWAAVRVGTFDFGDTAVSDRILAQIGSHLTPANRASASPPGAPPGLPPQTAPPPLLPAEPTPTGWNKPAPTAPGR
jgi:hypothetical protein